MIANSGLTMIMVQMLESNGLKTKSSIIHASDSICAHGYWNSIQINFQKQYKFCMASQKTDQERNYVRVYCIPKEVINIYEHFCTI